MQVRLEMHPPTASDLGKTLAMLRNAHSPSTQFGISGNGSLDSTPSWLSHSTDRMQTKDVRNGSGAAILFHVALSRTAGTSGATVRQFSRAERMVSQSSVARESIMHGCMMLMISRR